MRELLRHARQVLEPGAQLRLVFGVIGLVAISLLDMMAVALVYPLVTLSSGATPSSGLMAPIRWLARGGDHDSLLLTTAALVVALFIAKSIASIAFTWWLAGVTNHSRAWVSTRLLDAYLSAPFEDITRRTTSDLLKVQQDAVNQFMLAGVYAAMNAVANAASIVGIGAILLYSAPGPTLVLVAYFAATGALYLRLVRPAAQRAGRETITSAGLTWRSAMTSLGALKEIQLRSAQVPFVQQYETAVSRAARAHRLSGFVAALPRYVLEVLFIVAVGIAIILTSDAEDGATLGLLGIFVAAGFRVLPAITGLLGNISTIRVSEESARLVARDWQPREAHAHRAVSHPLPFERELVLRDVTFQYPGTTRPVLDRVALEIPWGATVALVGPSGAGKTTLVDIVLGFYEPVSGSVTVDGANVFDDLGAWRANVAYVPQDVFLIEGTIEDNITFDTDPADDPEHSTRLAEVVQQADLVDLLAELPDGLQTAVGERGSRLSGGQKQRIGMARALYRRPRLLVLDEATSALDNATEHRVASVIHGLGGQVTTMVVAHRLSTVREADIIVLLEDGRVSAVGTFDELRSSSATFADLVRLGNLT